MSDTVEIKATERTEFGKGAARRLRAEGKLPGVMYGHGQETRHLVFDTHELFLAIKGTTNAVLKITVGAKSELALVKDVQVDPVRRALEHIDLVIVKRGEKVTVDVPVITEGEPKGAAITNVDVQTLSLEVPATDIPEHIVIDVSQMEDGDVIRIADIKLPADAECHNDPEDAVVTCMIPQEDPVIEAEEEAAAEAAAESATNAAAKGEDAE